MPEIKTTVPKITPPARRTSFWLRLALYSVPIVLLAFVAVPNFVKARATPCLNACVNILRQIEGAKEQYALVSNSAAGTVVTEKEIGEYLKTGAIPKCPGGGKISIGLIGQIPTCSSPEGHRIEIPRR